jgi:hypothetical protein
VIVVTIPLKHYRSVPVNELAGKTVIQLNNYYPERDGHIAELDHASTMSSELLATHLNGARVVKAFNTIYFEHLASQGCRPVPPSIVRSPSPATTPTPNTLSRASSTSSAPTSSTPGRSSRGDAFHLVRRRTTYRSPPTSYAPRSRRPEQPQRRFARTRPFSDTPSRRCG